MGIPRRHPGIFLFSLKFPVTFRYPHLQSCLISSHFLTPLSPPLHRAWSLRRQTKQSILREVIHKWDNHISKEQKPFAGAGMGHIGKLVRGNPKLLCQNLSVPLSLVEHVDKIRVLENILNLTGSQKILYVLGQP